MNKLIKINLTRHDSGMPANEYEITRIAGAITAKLQSPPAELRAGNRISEATAERLAHCGAYDVTVIPFKA